MVRNGLTMVKWANATKWVMLNVENYPRPVSYCYLVEYSKHSCHLQVMRQSTINLQMLGKVWKQGTEWCHQPGNSPETTKSVVPQAVT